MISGVGPVTGPQVKAISSRTGITLISMETVGMWQEVGFLARAFATFARHGLSIDSVSTSETNVTVSLDPGANALEEPVIDALTRDLAEFCEPRVIPPTASLSLVGRGIRAILHELGPVLEVFEELKVHLLTQAASDLNLTFLVDEEQSERLVRQLHGLLFGHKGESETFGPTWSEMFGEEAEEAAVHYQEWWRARREELLETASRGAVLRLRRRAPSGTPAGSLRSLAAIDRVFYSVKANANPDVLRVFHAAGLGFECVSAAELDHVRALFPDLDRPAPALHPQLRAPRGVRPGLRGRRPGDGGQPPPPARVARGVPRTGDLPPPRPGAGEGAPRPRPHGRGAVQVRHRAGTVGRDPAAAARSRRPRGGPPRPRRQRHPHGRRPGARSRSSWPRRPSAFRTSACSTSAAASACRSVPGSRPLDLEVLGGLLGKFKAANPRFELWLEPGRFLVAQAGVLLARVTQVKRKGEVVYVGLETGMNSLIRPPLYGAYHPIVNLTRLDEPATWIAHVVGPICETGDILGRSRRLPPTFEGDVLLIANAGAYGRVMSSWYNLREPAGEVTLAS